MFEPASCLGDMMENNLSSSLSVCTMKNSESGPNKKKPIFEMSTEFEREVKVGGKPDKSNSWITGLEMINDDEIILADFLNDCLKVTNTRENRITSRFMIQPPAAPWDVTIVDKHTAAATLPFVGSIIFVNTQNGLSESHKIKVNKDCVGIDHKNGVLAVSFISQPAVIQIMNIDGSMLHEFKGADMLYSPYYIAMSHDSRSVYVSEWKTHAVHQFTIDGQHLSSTELEKDSYPRKVRVTRDGTVVVCCEQRSDEVSMIDSTTSMRKSLSMKGVQRPMSFIVCEEQDKIYITTYAHPRRPSDLKIFTLK